MFFYLHSFLQGCILRSCSSALPKPSACILVNTDQCKPLWIGLEPNMNPSGFSRQTVCQQDVSSMSWSKGLWKQIEKALRNKTAGVWTGNRSHTGGHRSRRTKPSLPCLWELHYLSNSFVFRGIWLNSDLSKGCSAYAEAKWLLVLLHLLIAAVGPCSIVLPTCFLPLSGHRMRDAAACHQSLLITTTQPCLWKGLPGEDQLESTYGHPLQIPLLCC